MADRRVVDELTIEDLEQILYTRKREARMSRVRQRHIPKQKTGFTHPTTPPLPAERSPVPPDTVRPEGHFAPVQVVGAKEIIGTATPEPTTRRVSIWSRAGDRLLLLIELIALVGLVVVVATFLTDIRSLNREISHAQSVAVASAPTETAAGPALLPGGSVPPAHTDAVPKPFRDLVQSAPAIAIPTPGPQAATRIVIPAIDVDAPVVEGDTWEELKLGVGHHIRSANPGERGNVVLSGHNDVFGEVFRQLSELTTGDQVQIYDSAGRVYRYRVVTHRIVAPTEVSVMDPASAPILTLITCHPYLVDTQRLIVIAELIEE